MRFVASGRQTFVVAGGPGCGGPPFVAAARRYRSASCHAASSSAADRARLRRSLPAGGAPPGPGGTRRRSSSEAPPPGGEWPRARVVLRVDIPHAVVAYSRKDRVVFYVVECRMGARAWRVCKRYSDFECLARELLGAPAPAARPGGGNRGIGDKVALALRQAFASLPSLPARSVLARTNSTRSGIERRRADLESYLRGVIAGTRGVPAQESAVDEWLRGGDAGDAVDERMAEAAGAAQPPTPPGPAACHRWAPPAVVTTHWRIGRTAEPRLVACLPWARHDFVAGQGHVMKVKSVRGEALDVVHNRFREFAAFCEWLPAANRVPETQEALEFIQQYRKLHGGSPVPDRRRAGARSPPPAPLCCFSSSRRLPSPASRCAPWVRPQEPEFYTGMELGAPLSAGEAKPGRLEITPPPAPPQPSRPVACGRRASLPVPVDERAEATPPNAMHSHVPLYDRYPHMQQPGDARQLSAAQQLMHLCAGPDPAGPDLISIDPRADSDSSDGSGRSGWASSGGRWERSVDSQISVMSGSRAETTLPPSPNAERRAASPPRPPHGAWRPGAAAAAAGCGGWAAPYAELRGAAAQLSIQQPEQPSGARAAWAALGRAGDEAAALPSTSPPADPADMSPAGSPHDS